ncbi:MAG: 3-deoxy-manno-octulosonate cytidylyltransferase [bacterium]
MRSDEIAIIIPARLGSTRLPGKPLIKINGKPLIQWVYEKAIQSELVTNVIVATDDNDIFNTVKEFGGKVEMTSPLHKSGSDRIAEVIKNNPNIKIAVNVQGDEPLIDPKSIDKAISSLIKDENADVATLARIIDNKEEIFNPNIVKVVFDNSNYALYFSRAPIPYHKNLNQTEYFAHIGLYVYRRDSLLKMTELEQTSLEKTESLEQLRLLENGMKIKVFIVDYKPIGIDTKEDLNNFQNFITN